MYILNKMENKKSSLCKAFYNAARAFFLTVKQFRESFLVRRTKKKTNKENAKLT